MLIQGGYDIAFRFKAPTPLLLQVHLRPELRKRLKTPEKLRFDPPVPFQHLYQFLRQYLHPADGAQGRCSTFSNRFVIRDSGKPDVMPVKARQAEVDDLPDDVMVYLLGSRYCDTDKLATLAWKKFGKITARLAAAARPSWTTAISASSSAISMPAPTAPRSKAMKSA